MVRSAALEVAYAIVCLLLQGLLVADFAARRWRPQLERRYGGLVYGLLGWPALLLGLALVSQAEYWTPTVGALLFATWAALGYWVDRRLGLEWRSPIRWTVLSPYVGLFIASQMLLWVPLWYIHPSLWGAFGVLYVASTALNMSTHRWPQKAPK